MKAIYKTVAVLVATATMSCAGDDGNATASAGSVSAGTDATTETATSTTATATATATATETATSGSSSVTDSATSGSTSTTGAKFDVGAGSTTAATTGNPPPACKVVDNMDAPGTCREKAPPNSFEPDVQWSWWGPQGEQNSSVTPLVANLTDDNADNEIDLCDIPDVVVVTWGSGAFSQGHVHVLDGATGTLHYTIPEIMSGMVNPAIADIDNDGLPEIVSITHQDVGQKLAAYEHDGTPKWTSTDVFPNFVVAIAIADLDNDGDVEIIAGDMVADHLGNTLFTDTLGHGNSWSASAAADLDGDMDQEVIFGPIAYHHDGTLMWDNDAVNGTWTYPQVANLDDDPEPEVLITANNGLSLLEHTGAAKYIDLRPTNDTPSDWNRPATVHDFDGDGISEYASSSVNWYAVYEGDGTVVWQAAVADFSGHAGGTAFDFLGDGIAEAMYADEDFLFIFDGAGAPLLTSPRTSLTQIEYPVVADIDNDGSAEILVVSNEWGGVQPAPTIQAIRDVEDRWIQARRIWNQHTYHVTNVREDSTIPQFEQPSWEFFNTYRTNVQIEGGGVCKPQPEG